MLTEARKGVLLEVWHDGRDLWGKPDLHRLSELADDVFKKGHIIDIRCEDAFLHSCREVDAVELHYNYFKIL